MHFLVVGATGPCGITFIETALQSGSHDLTIFCRNPSKLPQHIQNLALSKDSSPKVQIIKGEFTDTSAITQALHTGSKILVSFAGPAIPAKGTAVTEFYERLYPMILSDAACKIERVLVLSTPSFKVEEDSFSLKWWFGVQFVYWLFGSAYQEVNGIGLATTKLGDVATTKADGKKLEWTVFRVPGLTNSKAGAVRAGFIGKSGDGLLLSRKSLAVWVLGEVEERRWVAKCPALSNA